MEKRSNVGRAPGFYVLNGELVPIPVESVAVVTVEPEEPEPEVDEA